MKTEPMEHQSEALRLMAGREYYALLMQQGTGKTWALLADAERLYKEGKINAVLVIAPNGVHTNWVRREIPAHLEVDHQCAVFVSGKNTKKYKAEHDMLDRANDRLKILAINIDAINFKTGFDRAFKFVTSNDTMIIMDESSRIKTPTAGRTKKAISLAKRCKYRRIATGTPITAGPIDLFSQFEFLREGLLGINNYRSFVSRYATLLPADHPTMIHATHNSRFPPQIVARDVEGRPLWKNLDDLKKRIEPHSYRVLKKDCLDLPPKVYENVYFELTPEQRRAYDLMEKENRYVLEDNSRPVEQLAAYQKLQQITSGFVLFDGEPIRFIEDNPRTKALMTILEDCGDKVVIWAKYKEEIDHLARMLSGRRVVEYSGRIRKEDRELAIDEFQDGDAEIFIGQPKSGGIGVTLTASHTTIYYSNDFDLEVRLQSEDRNHRKGTVNKVTYYDIVAVDTRDEEIARSLQNKEHVAQVVLGDKPME